MPLPTRTPEGYRIIFVKVLDPERFNLRAYIKKCNFPVEPDFLEHGPDEGFIFIVDMNGSRVSHLAQVNLAETKQAIVYVCEGFFFRVLQCHFINPVPFMAQVVGLLKPFVREELKDTIIVHKKLTDLHKIIPAELLPNEYDGGKAGPLREINGEF